VTDRSWTIGHWGLSPGKVRYFLHWSPSQVVAHPVGSGGSFAGGKRPQPDADCLPTCCAKAKTVWSKTSVST